MRKKYLLPQQKIVEIDEEELLCQSPGPVKSMNIELNDYSTYTEPEKTGGESIPVDWDGVGTGSDF